MILPHKWLAILCFQADEHAKNHAAEKTDLSEPVVGDLELSSSDDGNYLKQPCYFDRQFWFSIHLIYWCAVRVDGIVTPEFVFLLSAKESPEQTLRSRTRQTNDADVKLESTSLQQEAPGVGSLSVRRIGVAVLMVVSLLCAGMVWFLNSRSGWVDNCALFLF